MGKLITGENDLLTWCLNHGERGKQLMDEWCGESESGKQVTLNEVSYGSSVKYKWKCIKGHFWYDTAIHRTYQNSRNCTICSASGTSYPEQFLYWALKQIYKTTESRPRVLKSPDNPQGIEYDIGISEIPLCIEYSPTYWHKGREEKADKKREICEKLNIRLIEIIDDTKNEMKHEFTHNYICLKINYSQMDKQLKEILSYILESLGHSMNEINLDEVRQNAILYSSGHIEYEKSLEYNYPELSLEWNTNKNKLEAKDIKSGSSARAYWNCIKCGYGLNGEWETTVVNRTLNKSGCPACGYNWFDKNYHKTFGSAIITKSNGLLYNFPELENEYHKELNEVMIEKLTIKTNRKIYWQCKKCGYGKNGEWISRVSDRTSIKSGCPACGYNVFDNTIHTNTLLRVCITGVNDLKTKFPELAKEWHPTMNSMKPSEIKYSHNKNVYWQCTKCGYGKNGEWIATPARRSAKGYETRCPKCKYKWFKTSKTTKTIRSLNFL